MVGGNDDNKHDQENSRPGNSDGATHVLALLNRTLPELRAGAPEAGPARWARALDRLAPGLGSIAQEGARHGPSLRILDDAGHPSRGGAHLLAVLPTGDEGVRGLTADPVRVRRAARAGHAAMTAAVAAAVASGPQRGGCTPVRPE